jgi:hypothetical protein
MCVFEPVAPELCVSCVCVHLPYTRTSTPTRETLPRTALAVLPNLRSRDPVMAAVGEHARKALTIALVQIGTQTVI